MNNQKQSKQLKKQPVKPIPLFKSEDEEREFWATHDGTEYFDFDDPETEIKGEFINLKPSTKKVTFRAPESLVSRLKVAANKKDIPYQSLIKFVLSKWVDEELYPRKHAPA